MTPCVTGLQRVNNFSAGNNVMITPFVTSTQHNNMHYDLFFRDALCDSWSQSKMCAFNEPTVLTQTLCHPQPPPLTQRLGGVGPTARCGLGGVLWGQMNTPREGGLNREKMDAISQTTLSNAFTWMTILEFRLEFHWNLFLRVQFTIFQHWFRQWLGADQATRHYLNQWLFNYRRIYTSLGLTRSFENISGELTQLRTFSKGIFEYLFFHENIFQWKIVQIDYF